MNETSDDEVDGSMRVVDNDEEQTKDIPTAADGTGGTAERVLDLLTERTNIAEIQKTTPIEAAGRYLIEQDRRDISMDTLATKLAGFVTYCNERDIEYLKEFEQTHCRDYGHFLQGTGDYTDPYIRSDDPQPSTVRRYQEAARYFLRAMSTGTTRYARTGIWREMELIDLPDEDRRSDDTLEADHAELISTMLEAHHFGTREHATFAIVWGTAARKGAVHGLNLCDWDTENQTLRFTHRPDENEPLKNGAGRSIDDGGERTIPVPDWTADAIDAYIQQNRVDHTDQFGREPILTTANGRVGHQTIRQDLYWCSCPMTVAQHHPSMEGCECEPPISKNKAAQCDQSVSPHAARRGRITDLINRGWEMRRVCWFVDCSRDTIERHYDDPDVSRFEDEARAEFEAGD